VIIYPGEFKVRHEERDENGLEPCQKQADHRKPNARI